MADFDAVVSGDIYVLAPKGKRLSPEVLPFVCLSDRFLQYAVETSAGSLSPRTNWSSLSEFRIDLPPLDQQQRLAEIFCAADALKEYLLGLQRAVEDACQVQFLNVALGNSETKPCLNDLHDFSPPKGWTVRQAKDIVSRPVTKGATPSQKLNTEIASIPFIKVYNLTFTGELDFSVNPTYLEVSVHESELKRSQIREGDILMNIVGPPLGKTAIIPAGFPESNVNQAIAIYRIDDPLMRAYFSDYLRTDLAQAWFRRRSKKTSGQENLTLKVAEELPVPIPPTDVLLKLDSNAIEAERLRSTVTSMLQAVLSINQAFRDIL